MVYKGLSVALLLVLALSAFAGADIATDIYPFSLSVQSGLWGESGERWDLDSRLPEYAFVGYHFGENPIPSFLVTADVKADFGAVGDGVTDDTQAFLAALNQVQDGTIFVPPGRYLIREVLNLKESGTVLKGAGMDETTLYFDRNLREMELSGSDVPFDHSPPGTEFFSSTGGVIFLFGDSSDFDLLAFVVKNASRGDRVLELSSTEGIQPGDIIMIEETDPGDGSMLRYMHGGDMEGGESSIGDKLVRFVTPVNDVKGNAIRIDRPLRADIVSPDWQPEVKRFAPSLQEVGIEDLTIEFDPDPTQKHHEELGANAIYVRSTANCWVRNVRVINADSAIVLAHNTNLCTVENIELEADRKPRNGETGHYGFATRVYAADNIFKNFTINTRYIHDLSVATKASGNVFANGSGIDINMDHHRSCPFANLFVNLDLGFGNRPWDASGNPDTGGPHACAYNTYWNLRADKLITPPPMWAKEGQGEVPWGREHGNFVGMLSNTNTSQNLSGWWWESVDESEMIDPVLIHVAQFRLRTE